jgi:hypothetical protein
VKHEEAIRTLAARLEEYRVRRNSRRAEREVLQRRLDEIDASDNADAAARVDLWYAGMTDGYRPATDMTPEVLRKRLLSAPWWLVALEVGSLGDYPALHAVAREVQAIREMEMRFEPSEPPRRSVS